ncbi:MAG: ketopantoate reductase family protein [Hyphomicrobiaceae bacterium]|nr:ketopantoate reductase family protein [Hyphomicrobiaceae bacterium]
MSKPNIVFLGAGAVGGYFGARLIEHDMARVTFLVRPARRDLLVREGLRIESPHGNLAVAVEARTAEELVGAAPDYLFITAKAYDLDTAIKALMPVVGPNTCIVPLLNGVAHIERLNGAFGADRILGGTVSLQVEQRQDGVVQHLNSWQIITIGEQSGAMSERVQRLKRALDGAKLDATASSEIMQKMWEKLVMLATLAGLTTLFDATVGEIASAPGGVAIARSLLATHAAAAAHAGYPVSEEQLTQWRAMFSDPNSGFSASMRADMRRGGPVEADHIIGFMLDRVRDAGLDSTLPDAVNANLKIYEARLGAGRIVANPKSSAGTP